MALVRWLFDFHRTKPYSLRELSKHLDIRGYKNKHRDWSGIITRLRWPGGPKQWERELFEGRERVKRKHARRESEEREAFAREEEEGFLLRQQAIAENRFKQLQARQAVAKEAKRVAISAKRKANVLKKEKEAAELVEMRKAYAARQARIAQQDFEEAQQLSAARQARLAQQALEHALKKKR